MTSDLTPDGTGEARSRVSHKRKTSEEWVSSKERQLDRERGRVDRFSGRGGDDFFCSQGLREVEFETSEALHVQRRRILHEAAQELNKHEFNTFQPCAKSRGVSCRRRFPKSRVKLMTTKLCKDRRSSSLQKSEIGRKCIRKRRH